MKMKIFLSVVITIVVATIGVGLWFVGSPKEERLRRFDATRVNHLDMIQNEIVNFWTAKGHLPTELKELNDTLRGFSVPYDPQTGDQYEYTKKSETMFTLCATFGEATDQSSAAFYPKAAPVAPYPYGSTGPFVGASSFDHAAGRICFDRTIDRDFFKPAAKPTL